MGAQLKDLPKFKGVCIPSKYYMCAQVTYSKENPFK